MIDNTPLQNVIATIVPVGIIIVMGLVALWVFATSFIHEIRKSQKTVKKGNKNV